MRNTRVLQVLFSCAVLLFVSLPALAADAFGGKVTEVRSAEVMIVDHGTGEDIVRIIGVAVPSDGSIADEAKKFVTEMVLGKEVRCRFQDRTKDGEMVSKVYVGEPGKDVGLELLKNGLARRAAGEDYQFGYKYGELSKAEREGREAKRGIWAPTQPK